MEVLHARGPCSRAFPSPNRYIRQVKGGKFQARPYDFETRTRDDLGLFATIGEARKAVSEYFWGKRMGRPKFVKTIHVKAGTVFIAVVPLLPQGGWRRLQPRFTTREAAGKAAEEWIRLTYPHEEAERLLKRDASSRTRYVRKKDRQAANGEAAG